jgi:predicted nuclease of restriction endonuclease-like (RecB) superfamily
MLLENQFSEILQLIRHARAAVSKAVNTELINLYWQVGEYISTRNEWGKSTVAKLALHIAQTEPGLRGFSDKNLWRMKQFYETYKELPNLSPLVREISWTNNLVIFTGAKTAEELEFYLQLAIKERYSKRELERQLSTSLFERVMIGQQRISPAVRDLEPYVFRDNYILEFLKLPEKYDEYDLQKALIWQMKDFILELGKDFLFMGEQYKVEVGNSDYFIDLVFYHRGLQCLIAFELKTDRFKPEYIGKLNFYLEALDRDVKRPNERPSIGILLCKYKDSEVVEYALSRNLSPTLVAEYQTMLPNKKVLQQKLHELFTASESNPGDNTKI